MGDALQPAAGNRAGGTVGRRYGHPVLRYRDWLGAGLQCLKTADERG